MEHELLFWFVCLSAVSGLIPLLTRLKSARSGWVIVYVAILVVCVAGRWSKRPELIYAAAAMWLVLIMVPAMLGNLYLRRFLQQRYGAARRAAQLLRLFHPADGFRELPKIVRALELGQQGRLPEAVAMLTNFQNVSSVLGLSAMAHLYRLTHRWEQLLELRRRHPELESHTEVLSIFLRALGETGDIDGLVALFAQHKHQIGRLAATSRDLSRLVLFAFLGKRKLVERLFSGSLALLPAPVRDFWLATADVYAGERDAAKLQFERLLPAADPALRLSVERRLANLNIEVKPPGPVAAELIEFVAVEQAHDESFGARPSFFSAHARATQLLIALNVLAFGLEIYLGGSENPDTLYRLGALHAPSVRAGEWWRLLASLFLHWGPLHLALNMVALWLLAPFVEFALGFRKFLLVYFLAGIGSMSLVMTIGKAHDEQLTVGASGCVMGLIGATGGLMLRGWFREKALTAKRRLIAMFLIIGMQTVFDAIVPQVSMTAHLSGALIGFLVTLLLRDRLKPEPEI